ncbi:MAG: agmatine deiminase family protein [Marinifilaceae bacterium]
MKMMLHLILLISLITACDKGNNNDNTESNAQIPAGTQYFMPIESDPHVGTWLQWPQPYQYGKKYAEQLEPMWISMTKELVNHGKVYIIAYNADLKADIITKLQSNNISLANVEFFLFKTNGVWARDNGPIFVFNKQNKLNIEGWGFNGWGDKFPYNYDAQIPSKIANALKLPYINLQQKMIIEGGAYEFNTQGAIILTESSVLNSNRNPGMTKEYAEKYLSAYLGVNHFIWLKGADDDITDMHVDGFARFSPDGKTIITMSQADLYYWELPQSDIDYLYSVKAADGSSYQYIQLPLTQNNVTTTYGKNLGIQASYVNYYVTNGLVLVPIYNDPNDNKALEIIQKIYPDRKVVGIFAQNIYAEGGMIHCVTQQQPQER